MTEKKFVVYPDVNLNLLKTVANELGCVLPSVSEFDVAEEAFNRGVKIPGTENGWSPKEMKYVGVLLDTVKKNGTIPAEFQVYLEDRGFIEGVPETVGTLLIREKTKAYNDLMGGLSEINTRVQQRKLTKENS